MEEKDAISGKIAHKCEQFREILNVHESLVADTGMNKRERVFKIITHWEQKSESASRRMFITALHSMHPYPNEIVDIILFDGPK